MSAVELLVLWFLRGFFIALFLVLMAIVFPAMVGMAIYREVQHWLSLKRIRRHG